MASKIATGDQVLTALRIIEPANRTWVLSSFPRVYTLTTLREAADLCGVGDADTLTRRQAIAAIVENF